MAAMAAAAAGSEVAYSGGVENGARQQASPNAILLRSNGVASSNHRDYPQPAGNNAAALAAVHVSSAGATASSERGKRKRGRPCKYDDPEPELLAIVPPAQTVVAAGGGTSAANGSIAAFTFPPGFCPTMEGGSGASHQVPPPLSAALDAPLAKRGWLPVTSAKKLQPKRAEPETGEGMFSLIPFVFTVQAGEDIASRAMSFSCNGWAVCILSANGIVSNVTLRQDSSSGTVNYEGRFKILSLAGSYMFSNSSGLSSRIGGLTVSLAGPDGRLLGGSVNGPFIAASPVQVLIGSILSDGKVIDQNFLPGSRGILSESSSGGHGSPPNIAGSFDTSNQPGFPILTPAAMEMNQANLYGGLGFIEG